MTPLTLSVARLAKLNQLVTLIVIGSIGYFLDINTLTSWIGFCTCILLALLISATYLNKVKGFILLWTLLFVSYASVNCAALVGDFFIFLISIRYYLLVPILAFCLYALKLKNLQKLLTQWELLFAIQIPILAIQYLVYYPLSNSWDSMVGTFGGSPLSGGNSAGLALFLGLHLCLVLARQLYSSIKFKYFAANIIAIFSVSLLAEIKYLIFITPIIFILSRPKVLFANPLKLMLIVIIGSALSLMLLYGYYYIFYSSFLNSFSDIFVYLSPELLDYSYTNPDTGEVGRIAAIGIWYSSNEHNILSLLFGSGLLSTKQDFFLGGGGALQAHSSFQLGNTTLSAMLWEWGIAGVIISMAPLIVGASYSFKALRASTTNINKVTSSFAFSGCIVCLLFYPYTLSLTTTIQAQWLQALVIALAFKASQEQTKNAKLTLRTQT
ncbi:hypothetical protein [Pseudomonas sp. BF-R-19]|uniref:hypothetical protein n=1 Tax=Pseudomonas sp. BF-R-19 TaxID=2832397 RepID=UPI001CC0B6E4|nr:hypothetical protein [Pseudomonas sp. BF-R-19]